MVQSPQIRTHDQGLRERELRQAAEMVRREGSTHTTRSGRVVAGILRTMSSALTRTANALDAPCERLEHDVRVIDRA